MTSPRCSASRLVQQVRRCVVEPLNHLTTLSATENPVPDSLAASLSSQHRYHRPSRVSSKLHWFLRRVYFKDFFGLHNTPLPSPPLRSKKGKGSPYSITESSVPELISVLDSQPAGDVSYKPGGRLPLLSARPAVTPATLKRAATDFAAW